MPACSCQYVQACRNQLRLARGCSHAQAAPTWVSMVPRLNKELQSTCTIQTKLFTNVGLYKAGGVSCRPEKWAGRQVVTAGQAQWNYQRQSCSPYTATARVCSRQPEKPGRAPELDPQTQRRPQCGCTGISTSAACNMRSLDNQA